MAKQTFKGEPLTVRIGEAATVQLPPRIFRVRLTGLLFESNKTFLLPTAMKGMRGLVDFYGAHPRMTLVVTGHTDRVGATSDNLGLSEERAKSVVHYLKDEVDAWLANYQQAAHASLWGTREDQHMLSAINDGAGAPFYNGPIDGELGPATTDAVTRFQTSRGLTPDGAAGPETRRALITAYMQLEGTTLPASATTETLGCGENHNEVPTDDEVDEPKNRRVEIFLFDGAVDPPVPAHCPGDGCAYLEWKQRTLETIDIDHDLCELVVLCRGGDDALGQTKVTLLRDGAVERQEISGDDGKLRFRDLFAGPYRVRGEKEGFEAAQQDVVVQSANSQPAAASPGSSTLGVRDGVVPASSGQNVAVLNLAPNQIGVQLVELLNGAARPVDPARAGKPEHGPPRFDLMRVFFSRDTSDAALIATSVDNDGVAVIRGDDAKDHRVLHSVKIGPRRYALHDLDANGAVVSSLQLPAGKITRVGISRARLSVLATSAAMRLGHPATEIKGQFDDLTLIDMVSNNVEKGSFSLSSFTATWSETRNPDDLRAIVSACHSLGTQVLVGMAHANPTPTPAAKEFGRFMRAAIGKGNDANAKIDQSKLDAAVTNFIGTLDALVFGKDGVPDADGLSFDIENVPDIATADQIVFFTAFYQAAARAMAARNKFVGVFVGQCGKSHAAAKRSGAALQAAFASPALLASARAHDYSIALANGQPVPNLILRPMAFGRLSHPPDGAPLDGNDLEVWFGEIIDHALNQVGLEPSGFQILFERGSGDGSLSLGSAALTRICANVFRPNHIGCTPFAHGKEDWNDYKSLDNDLNP